MSSATFTPSIYASGTPETFCVASDPGSDAVVDAVGQNLKASPGESLGQDLKHRRATGTRPQGIIRRVAGTRPQGIGEALGHTKLADSGALTVSRS